MEVGYLTTETTELLLQKCFKDSKAVAMEGNIMADAVTEELLAKAERQMLALKTEAKILDAPVKEAKKAPVVEKKTVTEDKTVGAVKTEEAVKEVIGELKIEKSEVGNGYSIFKESYEGTKLTRLARGM